jgi:hypothetical protein
MLLNLISTAILALTVLSLGQGAVSSACAFHPYFTRPRALTDFAAGVSMSFLLTCRSCAETRYVAGPALYE